MRLLIFFAAVLQIRAKSHWPAVLASPPVEMLNVELLINHVCSMDVPIAGENHTLKEKQSLKYVRATQQLGVGMM